MSLEFNHTCPVINNNKDLLGYIKDEKLEKITEALTSFKKGTWCLNDLEEEFTQILEQVISECEDLMENVRETNILMRDAADRQIEALKEEITELELQKSNLTVQVENLNTELEDTEEEVEELTKQLKDCNG